VSGPLSGIRVVELPAIGPVPFLGMVLADLGAEVIRVQKPKSTRNFLEESFINGPLGRGRRQLELDLRAEGATEIVLQLIERADILIEGSRPGVAERLGLGPDEALARNPRLVYGRLTGWGQDGPLALTAGHDITYLAISGLLNGVGEKGGPPVPPVNYVADFAGGSLTLGMGVLAAVLHARATGQGQVLDGAMFEGAAYLGTMTRTFAGIGLWSDERGTNLLDGGYPNYRCYETSDEKWVGVGPLEGQFWKALCQTLGTTPQDAPNPNDPAEHDACTAWLTEVFRTRTRDEWAALFAPLDACVAPVLTLDEAPGHPHAVARGSYVNLEGITVAAPAPRFSKTPAAIPAVGDPALDGPTILAELGYPAETVADLWDRLSGSA